MAEQAPTRPQSQPSGRARFWLSMAWVMLMLFAFLVGIRGMGTGFKDVGGDALDTFFAATQNPFVGLVVGILGTTIVQSSSVTTSMIVAMVAAPQNPLPIANAIPMIMGANIGTTVTNTLVALAHMGRPDEFRRAFSAATCHDFFNFLAVVTLLPLEIATHMLETLSGSLAQVVGVGGGGRFPNPVKAAAKAALQPIQAAIEASVPTVHLQAIVLIAVSMLMIFFTLGQIVKTSRALAGPGAREVLTRSLDRNPYVGIVVGIVVTVAVQSSSITTSLMVPLAGAGLVTLEQVFPVSLGANVGTTITALLASMAAPSETAALAVQIAAVHLLFNVIGICLVYPFPRIRQIPLNGARWLAHLAVKSRNLAIAYVLMVFYGLPALLIALSRLLGA